MLWEGFNLCTHHNEEENFKETLYGTVEWKMIGDKNQCGVDLASKI